jgi:cytochrome c oxidase subunit IV
MSQTEHNASHTEHKGESYATLVTIFVILMVLLVITVAMAYILERMHAGWISTLVALTIACIKAVLVILFFMHVRISSKLTWVFAAAAFFWLAIMITLSGVDYFSRADLTTKGDTQLPGQALLNATYGIEHQNTDAGTMGRYNMTPNVGAPTAQ